MDVLQNMQRQMEQEVQEVKRIENGKLFTCYMPFFKPYAYHLFMANFLSLRN